VKTNLAVVWVAPESNEKGAGSGGRGKRSGNGHPEVPTILVVEDEVLIRLSVGEYLRDRGYRVLEAVSAEEAQRIFRGAEAVELLFSDVDLGKGMDGLELAAWVRQHYPAVRILLASGVTRLVEDAERLCDGPFLSKPYSYEVLAGHIERALALSGRRTG
jgi:CheY-like chemotaxis protein